MFIPVIALLCAAPTSATAPAPIQQFSPVAPDIEGIREYVMPNGLKVVLVADPSKPKVTVNMTYFVGSRHENYGETGFAHLFEHMLFKGTKTRSSIKEELSKRGADANGTTSLDRTNYFETVSATDDNLDWALGLEADRMRNIVLKQDELDKERTVVRNEMERGETNPMRVLSQRMSATAFIWHNYGKSTIGARSDVMGVPISKLQAFYDTYYQPDNALLIISGKYDEKTALALVEKHFKSIPKPSRPLPTTYTVEPVQDGERAVTVRRVGGTPIIGAAYHAPALTDPEYPAVDVLARLLGDESMGRLKKSLVDAKIASGAFCWNSGQKDPELLACFAQLGPKDNVARAQNKLVAELESLNVETIRPDDVERAKTASVADVEMVLNDSQRIGTLLSEYAASGDWRLLFIYRDALKQVTLAQVKAAAKKFLVASNRTLGTYVPTDKPVRAEIGEAPAASTLVSVYKPSTENTAGEAFDANPDTVQARLVKGKLANGMQFALLPKKNRGGTLNGVIRLYFGEEKSLSGKKTSLDLMTDMLAAGTTKHTREAYQDALNKLNAQVNFNFMGNGIDISFETRRKYLPEVVALIAEALKTPAFSPQELDNLKRGATTMLARAKTEPQALARNRFMATVTGLPETHPLATESFETMEKAIAAATPAKLKALHAQFVGANNGIAAVVGDADAKELETMLAAHFGSFNSKAPYARVTRPFHSSAGQVIDLPLPDKQNAAAFFGAAVKLERKDPDYAIANLSAYLMGGGFLTGRIPVRLREKEGISYGAGTYIDVPGLDDGTLFIGSAIFAPQNLSKVERGIDEELKLALERGFTDAEFDAAKKGMLQDHALDFSDDGRLAGTLVGHLYTGRDMSFEKAFDESLKKATKDDALRVLKRLIDPKAMLLVKSGTWSKSS